MLRDSIRHRVCRSVVVVVIVVVVVVVENVVVVIAVSVVVVVVVVVVLNVMLQLNRSNFKWEFVFYLGKYLIFGRS